MKRLFVFLLALAFSVYSFGQALPVTPMQNAVSGVIKQKMTQRGFAANDPRFGVTLQNAGSTIAGAAISAAVVTAAGVTAPAWITAAVGVGLAGLFALGISLAVDGIKWLLNSDGSVSASQPQPSQPSLVAGGPYWESVYGSQRAFAGDGRSAAQGALIDMGPWVVNGVRDEQSSAYISYWLDLGSSQHAGYITAYWHSSGAPATCGPGQIYLSGGCTNLAQVSTPVVKYPSISDAVAGISPAEAAKRVNPSIVASIADNAWKKAASLPGYAGVPYEFNDPVTEADAQAWQSANPDAWPTVGDLVAPQPAPAGGTAASPWQLPSSSGSTIPGAGTGTGTSGGTSPGTNPGTGDQVNLGPDPGIAAPGLESIPTAAQILAPLLGLFPELRNFVMPSHQASCPTASFSLFGRDLVLDEHCHVLDVARPTLVAVMAAVWVAVGLFVLLSA